MICLDDCTCCKNRGDGHLIDGWIPTCDAFPNGIPHDFKTGLAHEMKECNNGIGFDPDENYKKWFGKKDSV